MPACRKACPHDRKIRLADGNQVCSDCSEWMIECEAISALIKPLIDRRAYLRKVESIRGPAGAEKLKRRMMEIHAIARKNKSSVLR